MSGGFVGAFSAENRRQQVDIVAKGFPPPWRNGNHHFGRSTFFTRQNGSSNDEILHQVVQAHYDGLISVRQTPEYISIRKGFFIIGDFDVSNTRGKSYYGALIKLVLSMI